MHIALMQAVKKCRGPCGLDKSLDDFHSHPAMADGHLNVCKVCHNADSRKRRVARDPEKERDRLAAWRAANPERLKEQRRRAHENAVKNGTAARSQRARGERKRGATVGPVALRAVLAAHGMQCSICNKPIEHQAQLTYDHVIPLARGGLHAEGNLRPAHRSCNSWKSDRLPEEIAGLTPPEPGEDDEWEEARRRRANEKRSESMRKAMAAMTPEQRAARAAKISAANTGRKHPPGHRSGGARVLTREQLDRRAASVRAAWAAKTPEELAEHGAKISAAKKGS